MIHPDTELRFVSDEIGYGVFATVFIPKGTIVYVKDRLEIEIREEEFRKMDKNYRTIIEKYSYIDDSGVRIISWDHAKYVNHRCECNTLSTGYGFEIAIRDIAEGEEITDEYGMFNIPFPIEVNCGCLNCRKIVTSADMDIYSMDWDIKVKEALGELRKVPQPLMHLMEGEPKKKLNKYLSGQGEYRSVYNLKYEPAVRHMGSQIALSSKKEAKDQALCNYS